MSNQNLIALPPERADMLREIAKKLDKPMADIIGELIYSHVVSGTIPDQTTGVMAKADWTRVLFRVTAKGGTEMNLDGLTAERAYQVADVIEQTTERPAPGGTSIKLGDTEMQIVRVGTSVVFAQGEHRRPVAYSVARDIARQLRRAAYLADQAANVRQAIKEETEQNAA